MTDHPDAPAALARIDADAAKHRAQLVVARRVAQKVYDRVRATRQLDPTAENVAYAAAYVAVLDEAVRHD